MKADRDTLKKLSALCGKLKSAWALQIGFHSRLDGLLPEIVALPSAQIDACLERAAKGDPLRSACLVPIACEHLFHPSLHHRIEAWLQDDSLPFRDSVLKAIGKFRLHQFASTLTPFFSPVQLESGGNTPEAHMNHSRAIKAACQLKSPEHLTALVGLLGSPDDDWNLWSIYQFLDFPGFDPKPWLQSRFRRSEVIDEIADCERYVAGEISHHEQHERCSQARQIWFLAELYGAYEKREVIEFLVKHLDFDQRSFSSQKFSTSIVCRGRVATEVISRLNDWRPRDYDRTKDGLQRSLSFTESLWDALRTDPSLAFQADCPVPFVYPSKHKTHKEINRLMKLYGKVVEEDTDLKYWLRQETEGEDLLLAFHFSLSGGHWRLVRLSDADRLQLENGETSIRHLYFRYSSRGALVAFHDQILVNASDLENRYAKSAIRKLLKKEAKKVAKEAQSKADQSQSPP